MDDDILMVFQKIFLKSWGNQTEKIDVEGWMRN